MRIYVNLLRMKVNEAVRALRAHVGKNQQVFATELGMSMRALQRYEQEQIPETKQLFRFERAAIDAHRSDLAQVFREALTAALGPMPHAPRNDFERVAEEVLLFSIRGTDFKPAAPDLVASIAAALTRANSSRAEWFIEEAVRLGFAAREGGRVKWKAKLGRKRK